MTEAALHISARPRNGAQRAPAAPSKRPASSGFQAGLQRRIARMMRRPFRSFLQIGMLMTGAFIAVNALMFQTARHPARLGSGLISQAALDVAPLPPSRPNGLVVAVPGTQPAQNLAAPAANRDATRPFSREASHPTQKEANLRGDFALSGMQAPPVPPAAVKSANQPMRDPIGDLIRSGESRSGESRSGEPRSGERTEQRHVEPARPVASAQRALAKLGYGVNKADGVYGEATRNAVERFEKDRRLPVTGELGPRTLRELAAASGQKID